MDAYWHYNEDDVQRTAPTNENENFNTKCLYDFSAEERCRNLGRRAPVESGFWGQIFNSADNEGDFSKERIPVPPVESEDEELPSMASRSDIKQKEKGTQVEKEQKDCLLAIKNEREETDEEVSAPYKLYQELQKKYILMKRKNKDNEMLLDKKTAKIQKLQEKNKELSEELKTIRSLNLRLQEQLLEILRQSLPKSGSRETGVEADSEVITPEMDEEGKIRLGPRVFLTREKWQRVQEAKSHSQFCKSLAVAIWGTEGLKERSVTGAKCNAVKDSVPKRPLSPEKITVIRDCLRDRLVKMDYPKEVTEQQLGLLRRYLSEKISDIRKRNPQTVGKPKDME